MVTIMCFGFVKSIVSELNDEKSKSLENKVDERVRHTLSLDTKNQQEAP